MALNLRYELSWFSLNWWRQAGNYLLIPFPSIFCCNTLKKASLEFKQTPF